MLLDINSPKSKAIFEAAHHLDALHRLWCAAEAASIVETDRHLTLLRGIAVAHFTDSKKIDGWLTELAGILKLAPANRSEAKVKYDELIAKLDGDHGFQTVYI